MLSNITNIDEFIDYFEYSRSIPNFDNFIKGQYIEWQKENAKERKRIGFDIENDWDIPEQIKN